MPLDSRCHLLPSQEHVSSALLPDMGKRILILRPSHAGCSKLLIIPLDHNNFVTRVRGTIFFVSYLASPRMKGWRYNGNQDTTPTSPEIYQEPWSTLCVLKVDSEFARVSYGCFSQGEHQEQRLGDERVFGGIQVQSPPDLPWSNLKIFLLSLQWCESHMHLVETILRILNFDHLLG